MSFDIVIRNGVVIDGSGNPWFKADVAIKNGKIVKVSRLSIKDGEKYIDAKGLFVAPGFVDLHNHSDSTALAHNRAENALHMGLTTMAGGQCGGTAYPVTEKNKRSIEASLSRSVSKEEVDWKNLDEWRQRVEAKGIGGNHVPYVGFGTVRRAVMGSEGEGGERYEPTEEELDEMKRLVDEAMRDGAFGLSTGLAYSEQRNAYTEEVIELCKIVAKYGGLYISHMRDEGDTVIESCWELVKICREAGVRGCISHHKSNYPWNWGKPTETMRIIDRARAEGLDVVCDLYPYDLGAGSHLGTVFYPRGVSPEMTREKLLQELKDPEKWEMMKKAVHEAIERQAKINEERKRVLGKRGVAVAERPPFAFPDIMWYIVYSKTRPDLYYKTLGEVAKLMGKEDWMDAARELFLADEGYTWCGAGGFCEDDVITILRHHTASVSTDSSQFDDSEMPFSTAIEHLRYQHPRGWGTYPRVLERYVREQKILRLEDAISKMTSLPAQFLNLKDRGVIREGNWADIVVFDPVNVKEGASWANPCQYPSGIPYVLVNGTVVIDKKEHTGALPGKVLFYEP